MNDLMLRGCALILGVPAAAGASTFNFPHDFDADGAIVGPNSHSIPFQTASSSSPIEVSEIEGGGHAYNSHDLLTFDLQPLNTESIVTFFFSAGAGQTEQNTEIGDWTLTWSYTLWASFEGQEYRALGDQLLSFTTSHADSQPLPVPVHEEENSGLRHLDPLFLVFTSDFTLYHNGDDRSAAFITIFKGSRLTIMEPVPAPGVATLLAIGVLAGSRRRRLRPSAK